MKAKYIRQFFLIFFLGFFVIEYQGLAQSMVDTENQKTAQSLSSEDMEIIRNLSLLENLDILQSEDVAFLQNYDAAEEMGKNGGTVHEKK